MADYRSSPEYSEKMPPGIPYIVVNEAAERFSYYGMKGILVIFMTKYMMDAQGGYDVMGQEDAMAWYHLFGTAVYFTPILGAILSDAFFGKYKTILSLSIVYCLGHGVLALYETREGLALGLTLIAIGSGGIKPCVSAHVGDQFGKGNAHLLEKVFGWFYFSINLGAFASTLLTPWLLANYGPSVAFGIPGALMLLATFAFWMGRNSFVHIPPHGKEFVKETFSRDGLKALGQLVILYLFVAMFWALFDQTGSAWVLQAEKMDREFLGITWLSAQIQAINPILILTFIPLFTILIYPTTNRVVRVTPLRKIAVGFFIATLAFVISAYIESMLAEGIRPNIGWQLFAYVVLTAAEVLVSITCLEFSYTQAPKKMKSLIMGLYLMSVAVGNLFTAGVNFFIQDEEVIAEGLDPSGTYEASAEKNTAYTLACEGGGATDAAQVLVEVAVPIEGDNQQVEDGGPVISEFTVDTELSSSRRSVIEPGTEITFSWTATDVERCNLRPDGSEVEHTGQKTVTPEKTTTYVLACVSGDTEIAEKITVVVTKAAAIKNFTVALVPAEGKEGAAPSQKVSMPPPGGKVTLFWDSANADTCSISARTIKLTPVGYYLFFAGAMLIVAIGFIFFAVRFQEKTYIQDVEDAEDAGEV